MNSVPSAAPPASTPVTPPDFRNLGVMLRALLLANAAMLAGAALQVNGPGQLPERIAELAAQVEPVLLVSMVLLYALARPLLRLPYATAAALILGVVLAVTGATHHAMSQLAPQLAGESDLLWHLLLAAALGAALLGYFRLLQQALSPALAEARLQALQARIRPHFLFNSLNAVLSLMRSDPRRAESALENLADLFRTLMADNRALTSFAEEVALTRSYLELEQLRLGERLVVQWNVAAPADRAAVPPLMLQPLVENAIYHGVEPGMGTGIINITAAVIGDEFKLIVSNPYHPDHQHRQGNRMALANIAERLRLHFDVEARLDTEVTGGRFEILLRMPYRTHT